MAAPCGRYFFDGTQRLPRRRLCRLLLILGRRYRVLGLFWLNALIRGEGRVTDVAFTEAVLCGAGEGERRAPEKAQAIIAG